MIKQHLRTDEIGYLISYLKKLERKISDDDCLFYIRQLSKKLEELKEDIWNIILYLDGITKKIEFENKKEKKS